MPRKPNTSGGHYNDPFPTRLRGLIDERGVTQETIATVLGVKNRQSVTGYIDGNTIPTIDKILALSKFFNVSTDYMLGVTNVKGYSYEYRAICDFTGLSENAAAALHVFSHGQKYENFLQRLIDDLCTAEIADDVLVLDAISDDVYNAAKVKTENKKGPDICGITSDDIADYLISRAQTLLADISKNALERIEEETIDWLMSNKEEGTEPRLVRLTLQEEDMDDG